MLFNLYLENIIQEALHNFDGMISINGRESSNLRLADDMDLIAGTEEELQNPGKESACTQNEKKCRKEQDHGQQQVGAKNYYINEWRTPRRSNIIQVLRVDHLL